MNLLSFMASILVQKKLGDINMIREGTGPEPAVTKGDTDNGKGFVKVRRRCAQAHRYLIAFGTQTLFRSNAD